MNGLGKVWRKWTLNNPSSGMVLLLWTDSCSSFIVVYPVRTDHFVSCELNSIAVLSQFMMDAASMQQGSEQRCTSFMHMRAVNALSPVQQEAHTAVQCPFCLGRVFVLNSSGLQTHLHILALPYHTCCACEWTCLGFVYFTVMYQEHTYTFYSSSRTSHSAVIIYRIMQNSQKG